MRPPRLVPLAPKPPVGHRRGLLVALAAVVAATLLCALLETVLHGSNLLLVYASAVVVVALRAGRAPALLATGAAIVAFNLVFVPPRWSLKPTDPQYYFTFLLMAAFGWLVGELSMRLREEIGRSERRAWRAQTQARFASRLVQARDVDDVVRVAQEAVRDAVGAACTVRTPQASAEAGAPAPQDLVFALQGAQESLGHLVVHGLSRDAGEELLELLAAMADQTAVAMERSLYEHRSVRALVDSETERLRSTLLASISHDFRTPLTTIVGSASSLLQQWNVIDEPQRRALLQAVLGEAQRLHRLSSNLLELTRLERGAVCPACEWCPAEDLVNEAVAAVGPRLVQHPLALQVPPEAVVWCDARLVEQALVNLLENAVRHTPPGTAVTVEVQTGAQTWTLAVSDEGPGFTRPAPGGMQAHPPVSPEGHNGPDGGEGLGLSICAAIARLHGGGLALAPGPGARITLTLPLPPLPIDLINEAR